MGARVIYYALKALAARKRRRSEREQQERQKQQRKCQWVQDDEAGEGTVANEENKQEKTKKEKTKEERQSTKDRTKDGATGNGIDEDSDDEEAHWDPSTLVENVVLLGSPVGRNAAKWAEIKGVVSGRLVNGYCASDGVLNFLYRYNRWELDIAGLGEVPGVENVDLGDIVSQHLDYAEKIPEIMRKLDLEHTCQPHTGSC
jgi:hypothetical protein